MTWDTSILVSVMYGQSPMLGTSWDSSKGPGNHGMTKNGCGTGHLSCDVGGICGVMVCVSYVIMPDIFFPRSSSIWWRGKCLQHPKVRVLLDSSLSSPKEERARGDTAAHSLHQGGHQSSHFSH